jgi:hypothetical protein
MKNIRCKCESHTTFFLLVCYHVETRHIPRGQNEFRSVERVSEKKSDVSSVRNSIINVQVKNDVITFSRGEFI